MKRYLRKLHHHFHIITTSSSPFFLLISHRSRGSFFPSQVRKSFYLTNLDTQNGVLGRLRCYSTMARTILSHIQLENAIEDCRFNDSWTIYQENMNIGVIPKKPLLNKLLSSYAQSRELQWLHNAYGIVEMAFRTEIQCLLEKETLISLSLALAKRGLPLHASTILRKLVEMKEFPHVGAWNLILSHIVQIHPGSHLAAEFLLEIGSLFVAPKEGDEAFRAMKPNTISFNVALVGCVLSGITRKAEEILSLLHRMRVIRADNALLILMAHVCERNGRKVEMRKLQAHIIKMADTDEIDVTQLVQFFNLLLKCYLKVGDSVSASQAVLEMLEMQKVPRASSNQQTYSSCLYPSSSTSSSEGDSDEKTVKEMLGVLIQRVQMPHDLVRFEQGFLKPTEKLYARLLVTSLAAGKLKSLAEFLTKMKNIDLNLVINSCISLNWLDQARGILNEIMLIGVQTHCSSPYVFLLAAYVQAERMTEVESLLRDIEKAGIPFNTRCHPRWIKSMILSSKSLAETNMSRSETEKTTAFAMLLRETWKEEKRMECEVHEWNNVIHYFSKLKLTKDANRAFRKMVSLGLSPTPQTFHSLVDGYAARGLRRKVKVCWGVMKSFVESKSMVADQEILDLFLELFVRIAYYEGAVAIVEDMEEKSMFVDKFKCRALMVKRHGRFLKSGMGFKHEARFEAAAEFKSWVSAAF